MQGVRDMQALISAALCSWQLLMEIPPHRPIGITNEIFSESTEDPEKHLGVSVYIPSIGRPAHTTVS